MPRDIREMEVGDYVKVGSGRFEKIIEIPPNIQPGKPVPKHWELITEGTNGFKNTVNMWHARSYHKKGDPEVKELK